MKKLILSLLFLGTITSCLMYTSCSNEEIIEQKTGSVNKISSFNRITINETDQTYVIKDMKTSEANFQKHLDGLIYTVDMKNKTVIVTKENEAGSIVCNLIKDGNSINYKFSISEFKTGTNLRLVPRWICAARCALEGAAIAALDGPAPLMDLAGIAHTIACAQDC